MLQLHVYFSVDLLTQQCAYVLVMLKHTNYLVKVTKTSWFGMVWLFSEKTRFLCHKHG